MAAQSVRYSRCSGSVNLTCWLQGSVICFEPLDENAGQIEHNAKLNGFDRITVRREALGNADDEERFLVSRRSTWGTLASTGREPSEYAGRDVTVRVRRLDSAISEDRLPPPDVMKIDVEGAEAEVLEGGNHTLRTYRPILLIELHGTSARVAQLLDASNYCASVLETTSSIVDSPWSAYVVAIPAERTELCGVMGELCRPEIGPR
jgi:FkbM family methyltransferase